MRTTLTTRVMRVVGLQLLVLGRRLSSKASTSSASKKLPRRRGEYLFGVAPCLAALQAGRRQVHSIFLKTAVGSRTSELKSTALSEVKLYAEKKRLDIHYVNKETLERMSAKRPHQGIVLDVAPINFKKMDIADCTLTSRLLLERPPVWLALDGIQDPMNFGAILRGAFFLGADRVIATAKNCCALSPVVSKASSGAMEMMPVFSLTNMPQFLLAAQTGGWEVVGTCSPEAVGKQTPVPVQDVNLYTLHQPTILVLGNEGYGVRKELSRSCTTLLTIPPLRPLPPGFDSLNVGVAAGIVLHRLQSSLCTAGTSAADETDSCTASTSTTSLQTAVQACGCTGTIQKQI